LTELREAIFFLDLKITQQDGTVLAANQYPFSRSHNLQPLMHVPRTTLDVSYDESPDGGTLWIKNIGHNTALFIQFVDERDVRSTAYTYFSDNNFCLLPGEARRVDVEFTGDGSNASPLTVTAWNTDAVMVA
jgi:hypothetical protein